MIYVLATIELAEGTRDRFLEEFSKIVPLVRAEEGCLEYGPTVDTVTDIAAQLPLRSNAVTVVEKWESLAALKAHLAAPHMQSYRPKVKEFVVKSQLQILEPC
ncbi:MAG: antibiotic biosynthesis monooxygenase [Planctomycetaceae bacterium]